MDRSDAELLVASAAGEGDAFAVFFRRHVRAVTGYALRVARNPDQVADLVSETFLVALEAAGRYRPETPTGLPWLLGIARRLWLDRIRRQARMLRLQQRAAGISPRYVGSEEEAVDAAIDAARQIPSVEAALARLPNGERDVFELVALHGLTPAEAAVALSVSPNAARLRLSRARKRLRVWLDETTPETAPLRVALRDAGVGLA
jgi:RNA polymerase sigma-70 factor (ECF subfamily)